MIWQNLMKNKQNFYNSLISGKISDAQTLLNDLTTGRIISAADYKASLEKN